MKELGDKLRTLRLSSGMTQEDAAKKLHIKRSSLANYESGIREPSFSIISDIADLYGVTVDSIIGRQEMAYHAMMVELNRQRRLEGLPDYDELEENYETIIVEKNSSTKRLFKALKGATDEEIAQAAKILEALRK